MKTKKELRQEILQIRNQLTPEQRHKYSQKIAEQVIALDEFQRADKIFLYASYKSEVDTTEILQQALYGNKQVYLPKVQYNEDTQRDEMEFYRISSEADLHEGYKGIREPEADGSRQFVPQSKKLAEAAAPLEKVLMLLPGAVFDIDGNRIGYGGGFYDRYLSRMGNVFWKIALAFDCQIVESGRVWTKPHDIRVDGIITESRKLLVFK